MLQEAASPVASRKQSETGKGKTQSQMTWPHNCFLNQAQPSLSPLPNNLFRIGQPRASYTLVSPQFTLGDTLRGVAY